MRIIFLFFLLNYELFLKSRGKLSPNLVWLPRDPEGELLFGVTKAVVICALGGRDGPHLDWNAEVGSRKPIWKKLEVGYRFEKKVGSWEPILKKVGRWKPILKKVGS